MTTAGADTLKLNRSQLIELAAQGDSYRFLRVGLPALRQTPEDWDLALQIARHYAVLGLVGPALDVMDHLPAEVLAQLDAAGARDRLRRSRSGRIPWSRLRAKFEANRRALLRRRPGLNALLEQTLPELDALELYGCQDGNFQLCRAGDKRHRTWLPRLSDHRREAPTVRIPSSLGASLPAPLLLEGLHFGWHLAGMMQATCNLFLHYSAAVFILEPNLLNLAAVLHLHDLSELLAEERLYLYAGPSAAQELAAELEARSDLPMPTQHTRLLGWGEAATTHAGGLLQQVQKQQNEHVERVLSGVEEVYCGRDAAWWAKRYSEADAHEPLRVLIPVSRYTSYLQYCARDLAEAFEKQGLSARILTEPTNHSKMSACCYVNALAEHQPDLVLIIDHLRREYGRALPAGVPFASWIQDQLPHLYCREAGASLGPLDFYITPNGTGSLGPFGYPPEQGMTWVAATDTRVYSNTPLAGEELSGHVCDFSYVCHQSRLPESLRDEWLARSSSDQSVRQIVDRAYQLMIESLRHPETACANRDYLLETIEDDFGLSTHDEAVRRNLLQAFIYPLAELIFRQNTLEWVADYCEGAGRTLHLYGNGWESHPRLGRYARGPAANGRQLRAIYQASRVNLQIIGTGAVHQRLLDGLAAGGFFLIRHCPGDTFFEYGDRLLEAVDRCGHEPDRPYRREEAPEVAALWSEARTHLGAPLRRAEFSLPRHGIDRLRELRKNADRQLAGRVFAEYETVTFRSPEAFRRKADRFLADAPERQRLADAMRATVIERFTYAGLAESLTSFIRLRLRQLAGMQEPESGRPAS